MAEKIESFRIRINGVDEEINSIDKLNKANAALRKEIRLMSFDTKDYEKIVKEKNAIIDKNTEIVKKNSDSLVKQKMNIGNYKSALEGLPGPLGRAASGVMALGKQFIALLANPIVLLITAIGAAVYSLGKAFLSTDSGATFFAAQMEKLNSYLSVYYQTISNIGKESGVNFVKHVAEAGKAAKEYAYNMDALGDAMVSFISEEKQMEARISSLQLIAQDQQKTKDQRIKALEEAIEIEKKLYDKRIEFARTAYQEELKNTAAKYQIDIKLLNRFIQADDETANKMLMIDKNLARARNAMRDEGQKKLEELYVKEFQLIDQRDAGLKRSTSRLSGLYVKDTKDAKEEQDKKAKAREEYLKQELEAIKYRYELLKDAEKEFNEAYYEQNDERLEDLQKTIDEEIKLFEEGNKAKEEVKKTDFENSLMLKELQITDEYELKRQQIENDRAMELAEAEKTGVDRSIIEAKYAQISANIERERILERIDILSQFTEQAGELLGNFITGQEADFKSLAKSTITAMLDQLKAIILIARVKVTAQSLSQPDSIATFGATGVVRAAIINGLISAAFAVVKTAVNKFASGGRVPGQSRTGDNVPVLVNSGEVILNENQQARLGGAETFRKIGVPGFAAGGVVPRPSVPVNDLFSMRELAKMINDKKVILSLSDFEIRKNQLSIINSSGI